MSSFANTSFSAAAKEGANNSAKPSTLLTGNNVGPGGGGRGAEGCGVSIGEWPARMNGNSTTSTTTTTPASLVSRSSTGPRRPSLSTTLSHHPNHHNNNFVSSPLTSSASSTSLNNSTNSNLYHPPHHYNNQSGGGGGSNGGINGPRSYSREEMLNIYKSMPSVALERGLQDLLKRIVDGDGAGGGKDILAEVCWVENGVVGPVALEEMTAEERELFAGNINSAQKQPPPAQNNQNPAQSGRADHNHHHNTHNNQNSTSSGPSRKNTGTMGVNPSTIGASNNSQTPLRNPNTRRNNRDAPDSAQSPSSPAVRDHSQQSHSSISRRRTDLRGSISDAFGGDLEKDPTAIDKKDPGSASRPNFGRWGSVSNSNAAGDRHGDDHDVSTSTSATVGRSMGLFRRGSAAWGNSTIGSAGGLALGMGLGSAGGGAAAFNNGMFGGSAGFALSGGVPSSSASNSADKKLGSKTGSFKGESGGIGEKSSASSVKSSSGEQDAEKDADGEKRPSPKFGEQPDEDRPQRLHENTHQNMLKEENEENESFEPDMGQQSQRYQFFQDASDPREGSKENEVLQQGERPMSSDTDPYGRRDSLAEFLQGDSINRQHQQPHTSITAAIGAEQARIKATSPFSHASGAGSSVTTPTRNISDLSFGSRDFVGGGGLGSLHTQLRDLNINQQAVGNSHAGSMLMGGEASQEESGEVEPLSPTETNPYQSPAPEKEDESAMGTSEFHDDSGFVGILGEGSLRRPGAGEGGPGSDGSGRSSTAGLGSAVGGALGGRGTLGMGDLGTPGGGLWGTGSGLPLGTPSRLGGVNAGPGSFFSTLGVESSSIGGSLLGTSGQGAGFGSMSRASKLGALFMEAEFQHQQHQQHGIDGTLEPSDSFDGLRLGGGGSMGVNSGRRLFGLSGGGLGDAESPLRGNDVNDLFSLQGGRGILGGGVGDGSIFSQMGGDSHHGGLQGLHSFPQPTPPIRQSAQQQQIPTIAQTTAQQTALVMPDKIQWEYRDPQGVIQGPFSGLEMHDWFKGGYFPQDLYVKRVEDPEFEPLSQLIRRIGNQREPFLVPLQGLVPLTQGGPSWGPASGWSDNVNQPPGTVQPPFANSFPTFGTTLTADQQNALERRKQEEQFLMARQREFLIQQQLAAKQAQALQQQQVHHLHPQSSLGGLQPPIGAGALGLGGIGTFGAVNAVGPIGAGVSIGSSVGISALQQGHHSFEPGALLRQATINLDGFGPSRLDEVLQHGMNQGSMIPGAIQQSIQTPIFGQQQAPNPIQAQQQMQQAQQAFQLQQVIMDRQRQQVVERQHQENEEIDNHNQQQQQTEAVVTQVEAATDEQKFEETAQTTQELTSHTITQPIASVWGNHPQAPAAKTKSPPPASIHNESQTQVRKVATPKATSPASQPRKLPSVSSPWQQVQNETSPMPAPFPPPPNMAPLSINVSSAARNSPVDTPHTSTNISIAPWAQKVEESTVSKGPSLKEIQEMETKQAAALAEAMAEQARKEAALQQSSAAAQPIAAPQIGLPSTATWASSNSPATTPGSTPSVWGHAKPLMKSATLPIQTGSPKKTLQQIQKEEEAKKVKSAQQATANTLAALGAQTVTTPGGKRYAELVGKQPSGGIGGGMAAGGVWTTVGAGGKIKTPGGAAATPVSPVPATTPSLKSIPSTGVMGSFGKIAVVKQHPNLNSVVAISPTPVNPVAQVSIPKTPAMLAQEEFVKWCRLSLKQLNSNVNQEEFLQSLLSFPPETDLIADSIYANSSTMDGNRFAEEFVRRRKSAQQGVVVEAGSTGSSGGGGWNEVAAKAGRNNNTSGAAGGPMSEPVGFKVVPGKKKGRK
ncbi:hypothetical protein EV426DRAFT_559686 [Tirmania nivea]|nr:hypothetical protein EV426DRAFT_559686 [Tirmania nivea]